MEELKRRAAQLDLDVKDLHHSTDANTAALDRVHERLDRGEKDRKWMVTAMVAGLLVILVVAFVAVRAEATSRRLDDYIQKVACPFYSLILGGYAPDTRSLNPDGSYPGSDREKYEVGFAKMRAQQSQMECREELIPPRTDR